MQGFWKTGTDVLVHGRLECRDRKEHRDEDLVGRGVGREDSLLFRSTSDREPSVQYDQIRVPSR